MGYIFIWDSDVNKILMYLIKNLTPQYQIHEHFNNQQNMKLNQNKNYF